MSNNELNKIDVNHQPYLYTHKHHANLLLHTNESKNNHIFLPPKIVTTAQYLFEDRERYKVNNHYDSMYKKIPSSVISSDKKDYLLITYQPMNQHLKINTRL